MATRKAFSKMTAGERAENLKQRMEQDNVEVWAKQQKRIEAEIVNAILITLRESTPTEIFETMQTEIASIPIDTTEHFGKFHRARLEAMRQWIQREIVYQLRTISETVEYVAGKCPNNLSNIKESLEDFAFVLQEPLGSGPMIAGLQRFKLGIGSGDYSRNGEVYSRVDMDYSYEKGFEAGYNKALAATSLNTTAFDDRDIDL